MNKSLKLALVAGTVLFAVPSYGMFRHGLKLISRITTSSGPNTAKRFFSSKQLIPYKKNQTDTTATDTATVKKIKDFVLNYRSMEELVATNYFFYKTTNSEFINIYHPLQRIRHNQILNDKGLADIDGNITKKIRQTALSCIKKNHEGNLTWNFE